MQCNLKSPNSHFLQHLSWGSLSTIHYILLGRNETIVKTGAWNLSTSDKKSSTIRRIEQRSNNPTQHKVANHQQLLFFEQVRIVKFNQGTITKPRGSSSELQKLTLSTLKISSQSSSLSQVTTTDHQAVKRTIYVFDHAAGTIGDGVFSPASAAPEKKSKSGSKSLRENMKFHSSPPSTSAGRS